MEDLLSLFSADFGRMDGVNKTCFCLLGPTVRFIQEHRFEVGSFWIICFAVEMLC